MKKEYADFLLDKTKENYDSIAGDFSLTRDHVWEEFSIFNDYIKNEDKILDLGCGNGRLLETLKSKDVFYVGLDNSKNLIEIAKKRWCYDEESKKNKRFIVGDALSLPFPDNSFNKIFSIAVLHHIPSKKYREDFLAEAKRALVPGGILILTVWNIWGLKRKTLLIVKNSLLKIFGKVKLDFGDVFIPWQNKYLRYVHAFTKKELIKLAEKAGFQILGAGELKRDKSKNTNIFIVLKK